ncbi:hypothetical protein [Aeromonas enteropelogenes]|uniref:hypothetical protein n=1 Tax=Aeromonas enteropelogenes TaxID=29489 RepID=UPI000F546FF2|nr:hypothetical protein [Aeromonas enteropelogenes]RQM58742.1 hypothetical protein EHZ64_18685 [Aeromonas enteropelogenes]
MTQAEEQGGMDAAPSWDKQSVYLRLQDGIPMAFWVKGEQVSPLEPSPEGSQYRGHFGWGRADEATMALADAIVARLVVERLIPPELAASRAGYLHNEVLVKLPAGEHYDLHLSYLRLLLGEGAVPRP